MDKQFFGKLIAFLFLLFKFLILPVLASIISIVRIKIIKDDIKKAGIMYYKKDDENKTNKFSGFFPFLFVILSLLLIFFIFMKEWFDSIITLSGIIIFTSFYISFKKFNNIYGIYENGIINANKELVEWKKIQSYEIKENNVSGYCKDGTLFEFNNIENIDEIKNLFEKNKVIKRYYENKKFNIRRL
jgi:hypothetical protein